MTTGTSELAARFFEKYGGICQGDLNFDYSETLSALNLFVPFPVFAVQNANFNAIAVSSGPSRFIGIFSGLLNACSAEIFEVLSNDRVRQLLPDEAELPDDRWATAWEAAGYDRPTSSCAWLLSYCMILFVLFHEAAHLSCGHHKIIAKYEDDAFLEFPALALTADEAELRRALELDADHVAARSSLLLWRDMCGTFKHDQIFRAIDPDEFWLTALTIFFCLAQRRGNSRLNPRFSSHPTMSARVIAAITEATTSPLVEPHLKLDAKNQPLFMEVINYFQITDGHRMLGMEKSDRSVVADEIVDLDATMRRYEDDLNHQRGLWAAELGSKGNFRNF